MSKNKIFEILLMIISTFAVIIPLISQFYVIGSFESMFIIALMMIVFTGILIFDWINSNIIK